MTEPDSQSGVERASPHPGRSAAQDRAGRVTPRPAAPSTNGVSANGHGTLGAPAIHPFPGTDAAAAAWETLLPRRARGLSWRLGQGVKRGLDLVLAGGGLVVLLPFLAVVGLLVKATSRGPILYRSTYVGHRGRTFVGYKFRSMVRHADDLKDDLAHLNHMRGPAFKIRNDPRVTPLGRILRKFSIDELPQLWNVVRGDMSLVGPRPPLPEEYERFEPWQRAKLAVRPGITCFWQIQGRSEICDFAEWARLDLKYIDEWSLWTDFKILVWTVPAVFRGDGAY